MWYLHGAAFDADDAGTLYLLENRATAVKRYSVDGKALPELKLNMGANRPADAEIWFNALRVSGNDLIVRRSHPTELFQRYDLATGELRQVVTIEHERFTVTFPNAVWTAGETVPFSIRFDAGGQVVKPRWRVWVRPYEVVNYREFELEGDMLYVPDDCAGVYRLKVTPETHPWERGEPSEYLVQTFVEIRRKDSQGTVTVLTPGSRVYYARGERIPFTVVLRSANKDLTRA